MATFQTLRQQAQANAIVPENLDQTAILAAEGKHAAIERTLRENLLHLHGKTRHSTPHIRSAAPSTFASTRTDTPRDSVISIRPSG
jgi:hypothetical protein